MTKKKLLKKMNSSPKNSFTQIWDLLEKASLDTISILKQAVPVGDISAPLEKVLHRLPSTKKISSQIYRLTQEVGNDLQRIEESGLKKIQGAAIIARDQIKSALEIPSCSDINRLCDQVERLERKLKIRQDLLG